MPWLCGTATVTVFCEVLPEKSFGTEFDRVIPSDLPIRRGVPAAFGINGFIAGHADNFPCRRTACVGHVRVYLHRFHLMVWRPEYGRIGRYAMDDRRGCIDDRDCRGASRRVDIVDIVDTVDMVDITDGAD